MNINLIYEGNKFQFDVPQTITIEYIKGLSSKIFGKNPQMNLLYNGDNLLKYSDNILLKDIIKEDETNIIINVQKVELQNQSSDSPKVFSNSSIDNSTTINDNEIIYQQHKKKFIKFQKTFTDILKEISLFDEKLDENFNKLMKLQKEYKKYIKIIDEKLSKFYDNSSYDYLFQIFDNNVDSKSLTESDINKIGIEIENCIFNYKYLQVQKNFQENIITYIQYKIDELLSLNPFINQINGIEEFNSLIKQIEIIFNELNNNTYIYKPKNLISSFLNLKFEDLNLDHLSRLQYYKYQKTLKKVNNSLSEIPPLIINDNNINKQKYHLKSNSNNKPFTNFKVSDIPKVNIDSLKDLKTIKSIPSFPSSKKKEQNNDIDNEDYLIAQTLPNEINKKDKLFIKSLSPKPNLSTNKKEKIIMPKIVENENKILKTKENIIEFNDKPKDNLNKNENHFFKRSLNKKNTIANKILEEKRKQIQLEVQLFKDELKSKKKKKKKKKEINFIEDSKEYHFDKEKETVEKSNINQRKKKKINEVNKEAVNNKINENKNNEENQKKNKLQEKKEIDLNEKNIKEKKGDNKEKQNEIIDKKYNKREKIDLTEQKEEKDNLLKTITNGDKENDKNLNMNKVNKKITNNNENENGNKDEKEKEKENKKESENQIEIKQSKKNVTKKNLSKSNLNVINIPNDNNNSFNSKIKEQLNNFKDDLVKLKDDLTPVVHQALSSSDIISKNVLTYNYNNDSNKELVKIIKNIDDELEKQNDNNQNYNSDSGKKKKSKKKSFNKFDFII